MQVKAAKQQASAPGSAAASASAAAGASNQRTDLGNAGGKPQEGTAQQGQGSQQRQVSSEGASSSGREYWQVNIPPAFSGPCDDARWRV